MTAASDTTTVKRRPIPAGRGASRRLATLLRKELTSGKFGAGDKLPTHRILMQQFKVGYGVANRAMEILASEGLIQRQQGLGSFATERAGEAQRAGSPDTFALVLAHPRWSFNLSLCEGSDAVAGRLHLQTFVCDTGNDIGRQALVLMQLIGSRVAGIALVPTTEPETPECQIRVCQECGIPVVLLHRGVQGVSAPLIALPFEEIGYQAGKALGEQGHHRVACLFSGRVKGPQERWEAGLHHALEECSGVPPELSIFLSDKWSVPVPPEHEKFLDEMLAQILRRPAERRATAIVAVAEDDAEWVYTRLMKMGVRVPDEMSLITIGSSHRRQVIDQQLSAVTIDETGVGQLAARLLSEMKRGQRPINDAEQFTAKLGFHVGQTLGPAPTLDAT